ncbi:MAG: hypothetical protein V4710_13860, partial [Verrucomicrobiota bacterium]
GEAKPVEQAEASENAEKALAGITLVNKGRDLSLERLRVRTWDGKPPGKVDLTQPRIELADGRVMEGRIGMASLETIRVESAGTELALSPGEVDAVIFSPDRPRGEEPQAALQYSDGTLLRGRIFSIAEGRILLETSFAGEPFASRGDGLRQLLLN